MTYFTIKQIKQANKALGHHFFSPSTMRFFNSRVLPRVYGQGIFITGEDDRDYNIPRHYTVRYCGPEGHIETLMRNPTSVEQCLSVGTAKEYAKRVAKADLSFDECKSLLRLCW